MPMIAKEVFCTLQFEAMHRWENAPDRVAYLRNSHRHVFHVVCRASVKHENRDIEFIMLKNDVLRYCRSCYESQYDLGEMSCEMIAQDILDTFPVLYSVEVSEDGENGAIVSR